MKHLFTCLLLIFSMATLLAQHDCFTPDDGEPIPIELMSPVPDGVTPAFTVQYVVDYSIIDAIGLQDAQALAESEIEKSRIINENAGFCRKDTIIYMTTPQIYSSGSSLSFRLLNFRLHRPPSTRDIDHLLVWQGGGGLASGFGLLGTVNNACVSGLYNNTHPFPTYSWNPMVITHEEWHIVASRHTHACVWNGNNTAIDGCAGFTEGGCPLPGPPISGSGQIMSYCHLVGGVSIDFTEPVTEQVYTVLANALIAHGTQCEDNPPPPPADCDEVVITVYPDVHTHEPTYFILNQETGDTVTTGGPWGKDEAFGHQRDTVCLPLGCYEFQIHDPDGLTGQPCGDGWYNVEGPNGVMKSGAAFSGIETYTFCFPDQEPSDCVNPGWDNLRSYANQDAGGTMTITGNELFAAGNTWKFKEFIYTSTPNTVVSGEFMPNKQGQIIALAMTQDTAYLQPQFTYRLHGTQHWGVDAFADNSLQLGEWHPFEMQIGQYLEQEDLLGQTLYFVYINDDDDGLRNAETYWRNIEVCEDYGPETENREPLRYSIGEGDEPGITGLYPAYRWNQMQLSPYPNPVSDVLSLPEYGDYELIDVHGRTVAKGCNDHIDVSGLPAGIYHLKAFGATVRIAVKQV